MTGPNRLHLRIMLPFVGLILAVGVISLLLSRHTLGRLMDQRLEVQSQRISRVLSNAQFVFNPIYLEKLRDAIDSDIVVFAGDGTVKATTLDSETLGQIAITVDPVRLFGQLAEAPQDTLQRTVSAGRRPFLITARILPNPTDSEQRMMLWVLADMADAKALLSSFTARILLVGAGGILLVLILGYLIARSVSRPVDDLVAVTGEIADGRFERQADLPSVAELRVLAQSVNTMSHKLADYREQAARSSRLAAAGKITAAMAHEIKNPLSSIKMLAQLLRDRLDKTPENREIVRSILEEIVRLERIVGDLSNRLRPTAIKPVKTDLNRLIDQLIPVIRPKLAHRKITVRTDSQDDLPQLTLDPDKVKQVLWNLLLNAMESMPAGGAVTVRTLLEPAGHACICVEDEGGGIDNAHRDALFDPFFTTKPEGLGLGLSTSREIITAHGGTLTLENMTPAGVRATIALPLQSKENCSNGQNIDRR
ncbi:MAG: HAMP domain-containing protein [Desulfosarcina sp.]|nr:HAMP domain-containing protein [Desulfosarcina sp.]MBC2741615.1 HAMP domain-containing protein [Desulfosarcina sp.]MBC2764529.1 HAMP domain-containing protein [Desulfosarcina sp.]